MPGCPRPGKQDSEKSRRPPEASQPGRSGAEARALSAALACLSGWMAEAQRPAWESGSLREVGGGGSTQEHRYLLIVLQLIIQDDAVGLVGLGPREGDAVHGAAHLVHDGHGRRS